jgi:outer membrane protein assembly factor BamB
MGRQVGGALLLAALLALPARAADLKEDLWAAAKKGDAARVEALLTQGVDVNARTTYGATALSFAANRGHAEVVKVLLKHKADVNVKDRFYQFTPLTWAVYNGHAAVVTALLEAGATGADQLLAFAATLGKPAVVRALLDKGKIKQEVLDQALATTPAKNAEIRELLTRAGARASSKTAFVVDAALLKSYAGTYRSDEGVEIDVALEKDKLVIKYSGRTLYTLQAIDKVTFSAAAGAVTFIFQSDQGKITACLLKTKTAAARYLRVEKRPTPVVAAPRVTEEGPVRIAAPANWPSFRGLCASGVADGQQPPTAWDVGKGTNVLWRTPIPGLGHSCPVVWGDRVFVTTAVSGDAGSKLRTGQYGDVASVNDATRHSWRVFCLNKRTGQVLWERVVCEGVPKVKRHPKSTHANPTPATDGTHVVACFGSEGLYCYDLSGKLLWKQELGVLDSGWFFDADYQWGYGSSPIIYRGLAIVQCDAGKNSFIAAYHLKDGKRAWLTPRDEVSSWGTPTIWENGKRVELVANGTKYVRGYDPLTGKELWRLGGNSEITVPTPVAGQGLIFVMSGYRDPKPLWAIRPEAAGDITPQSGKTTGPFIAWKDPKGGTYMPTPIVYGDYLYTCASSGIVTCYQATTGKRLYRERLASAGGYTASPVAADGKLYFASEEGKIQVVRAGPKFELLATSEMKDACLATPAIADGMLFVRTEHFLYGIGRRPESAKR